MYISNTFASFSGKISTMSAIAGTRMHSPARIGTMWSRVRMAQMPSIQQYATKESRVAKSFFTGLSKASRLVVK